jgi:hypothetical protein
LRNTLINTVRNVPVTYDRIYIAALIKKAWNAFREVREVRNLSWRRGRSSPEVLPVPPVAIHDLRFMPPLARRQILPVSNLLRAVRELSGRLP